MEHYLEFDHRPDIDLYPRQQQRDQPLQPLHQQAQLPPFKDVIPPLLHNITDTQNQNSSTLDTQSDILTPTSQAVSVTSRSIATSPTQSQSSSMPSLTEGFEDVHVRGHDVMFATQTQPMATMDRASSWMPTSQYQSMSTGFHQPTQRMSQMTPQQMTSRTSPSLPPLRDINQRSSGFDQTYATTAGQMTYVTQAGTYPQLYSQTPQTTTDIDAGFGGRNLSYDGTQYARYASSYPQTSRSYQAPDYSRFSAGAYDPYRYNAGYRASYGDMNYSPQAMVSSQPANFAVPGDLSSVHNRRRRGNLPKPVTDILRSWFHDHLDHPYPSEEDKQIFIQRTGLTISQISNWFINARRRHWPALRQNRDRARNSALRRSNSAGGSV